MKVTLAQINTTPRDITGNLAQIREGIAQAIVAGSDCVIFPELSIPGYGIKDCIYDEEFINANLAALEQIKVMTRDLKIFVIVGYIDHNRTGAPGKPFFNCAAVIKNGIQIGTYRKHLLPFYDVFDEGRYYEPGHELLVWSMCGEKWGLIICEDGWNDKGQDDYNYEDNPLARYRAMGINNIVSINSSPFTVGKPARRLQMFRKVSEKDSLTLIYVNQIGGQDELVFDGHSFVTHNGAVALLVNDSLNPTYTTYDLTFFHIEKCSCGCDTPNGYTNHIHDIRDLYNMILVGTRDYARKSGFHRIVFASSGGIDSAVVGYFATKAVRPEDVFGVRIPSVNSSAGSKDDAAQLHRNLSCRDSIINIDYESLLKHINVNFKLTVGDKIACDLNQEYNPVADENIQARLRGMYVMHLSNAYGMLPLTTGNKSELALGYFTLYGDACGGFAPIGDCYKMEVYALARYINTIEGREVIPQAIIDKEPSAELKPNQKDTDSLLPYLILDTIIEAYVEDYVTTFVGFMRWIDNGVHTLSATSRISLSEWLKEEDAAKNDYIRMVSKIDKVEFKRRQLAPNVKVHRVAFGSGRRLPIAKGYY